MQLFHRKKLYPLLASACGLGMVQSARGVLSPEYTILDLNTLGGSNSEAYAINNSGVVVGRSYITGTAWRAFQTSPNSAINPATDTLPILSGGNENRAYGINASGVAAGWSASSTGSFGVRYSGGGIASLSTLGGGYSYGQAINNIGEIVGSAGLPKSQGNFPTHAVLYSAGVTKDLGNLNSGDDSFAYAINTNGTIVGYSGDPNGGYADAFVWAPTSANATTGAMTAVGNLGGGYSYAYGINGAGQIVGSSTLAGDSVSHAFLRNATGSPIDLQTLGGSSSEAKWINNLSMLVGDSSTAASAKHAFLYTGGALQDLNSLIPAGSNWTLQFANAINDKGQIVGNGINPSGAVHAFLLTPLPTWATDANGNWSDATKWLGSVPSGANAEVRLTGAINSARTVTLDSPRTVGHLVFDSASSYTVAGPGNLTISGSTTTTGIEVRSGSHTVSASVTFTGAATLSIGASSMLKLSGPVAGSIKALNLLATNSTLDLTSNNLIVDYSPADGSPLASIGAALATGYNHATWTGPGITSSTAAAIAFSSSNPYKTALGYGEASTLGITNFNGQSVDSTSVLVRYTMRGDANLDGKVNALDFNALATNFGTGARWDQGDFNYDGVVNTNDFAALAMNFGTSLPTPELSLPASIVPEPAALMLVTTPLVFRRRRRK